MLRFRKRAGVVLGATVVLALAACGSKTVSVAQNENATGARSGAVGYTAGDLPIRVSGAVTVDGSSTVYPMNLSAQKLATGTHPDVKVSVAESGTGGGFEKFCAGQTDISAASRAIKDTEKAKCDAAGIRYTELRIATDALTVAAHRDVAVDCLTVDQLTALFGSQATAKNWKDIDPSFPDQQISFFIPGTKSGTYDYMAAEVVKDASKKLRSDVVSSEDDNVLVQGISSTAGAVGFFGYSYFEENQNTLKALKIDGGAGCVAPSAGAVLDGSYKPLARPLYLYVKNSSYTSNDAVKAYVNFYVDNLEDIAKAAKFILLTTEQYASTKATLAAVSG